MMNQYGKDVSEAEAPYFKVTPRILPERLAEITKSCHDSHKKAEFPTGYPTSTRQGLALHQTTWYFRVRTHCKRVAWRFVE